MTNALATWFANNLGNIMPAELVVFIVSLFPILECRGGLIVAALLGVKMSAAIPICIVGNVLPVPFILRFLAEKIEDHAKKKNRIMERGEFLGLLLFVGIPLPGTGAWTGSLIATLFGMDRKKAVPAILLGVLMATVIMTVFSYAFLANVVG